MKKGGIKNIPASVRDRLLAISRKNGEPFQLILTRYALDRLLRRLSISKHKDRFVLKGAMLFTHWTGQLHRPTRDLDLLGVGYLGADELRSIFTEWCSMEEEDGLELLAETIVVAPIREEEAYGGQRITLRAKLGSAVIPIQVDIGFGDVITPTASIIELPTLLDMPTATLRAYPMETVIAEKVHAMSTLGMSNSRMKDYFDVWYLSNRFEFDGNTLSQAMTATFERRQSVIADEVPKALSNAFAMDDSKMKQWTAFVKRSAPSLETTPLVEVIATLRKFILEPLEAARVKSSLRKKWRAGIWK